VAGAPARPTAGAARTRESAGRRMAFGVAPATLCCLFCVFVCHVHAADPLSCTPDATGCLYTCDGGYTFDLTSFAAQNAPSGYVTVDDAKKEHTYYFSVCKPLSTLSCNNEANMAVIQAWGDPTSQGVFPSYACENCGTWASQACLLLDSVLTCTYTGGDGQRSVQILYSCGTSTDMTAVDSDASPPAYVIAVTSPDSCAVSPAPGAVSKGLSGGGLFLILFSVAVLLYGGGGTWYNIKYREKPQSMEAFPHIEYWRELPGLVKDGCKFSWKHTKRAAREAHSWYVGTDNEQLKQGLTAAEEGDTPAVHAKAAASPAPDTPAAGSKSAPDF